MHPAMPVRYKVLARLDCRRPDDNEQDADQPAFRVGNKNRGAEESERNGPLDIGRRSGGRTVGDRTQRKYGYGEKEEPYDPAGNPSHGHRLADERDTGERSVAPAL